MKHNRKLQPKSVSKRNLLLKTLAPLSFSFSSLIIIILYIENKNTSTDNSDFSTLDQTPEYILIPPKDLFSYNFGYGEYGRLCRNIINICEKQRNLNAIININSKKVLGVITNKLDHENSKGIEAKQGSKVSLLIHNKLVLFSYFSVASFCIDDMNYCLNKEKLDRNQVKNILRIITNKTLTLVQYNISILNEKVQEIENESNLQIFADKVPKITKKQYDRLVNVVLNRIITENLESSIEYEKYLLNDKPLAFDTIRDFKSIYYWLILEYLPVIFSLKNRNNDKINEEIEVFVLENIENKTNNIKEKISNVLEIVKEKFEKIIRIFLYSQEFDLVKIYDNISIFIIRIKELYTLIIG